MGSTPIYSTKSQEAIGKPNRNIRRERKAETRYTEVGTVTRLWNETVRNTFEKSCKFFQKPLDKLHKLCYNRHSEREVIKNEYNV